jgi:hypothetical protein
MALGAVWRIAIQDVFFVRNACDMRVPKNGPNSEIRPQAVRPTPPIHIFPRVDRPQPRLLDRAHPILRLLRAGSFERDGVPSAMIVQLEHEAVAIPRLAHGQLEEWDGLEFASTSVQMSPQLVQPVHPRITHHAIQVAALDQDEDIVAQHERQLASRLGLRHGSLLQQFSRTLICGPRR